MEWRYIQEYGVYVSEHGDVKVEGEYLSPFIQTRGYKQVRFTVDGKIKSFLVHRLVAMAFLDLKDSDVVSHRQGKLNNHHSNLIVHNRKKAIQAAVKLGSYTGLNCASILTVEQVRAIREEHPRGNKDVLAVASRYNVSKSTIQKILNGRIWGGK